MMMKKPGWPRFLNSEMNLVMKKATVIVVVLEKWEDFYKVVMANCIMVHTKKSGVKNG